MFQHKWNISGEKWKFFLKCKNCLSFDLIWFLHSFFWQEKKYRNQLLLVNSLIFFSRLTGTLKMYVRKYFKPFEHVISYQSITWNKVLALAKVRNADFVVNISLLQSTLLLHTSKVYYILNEWHLAVFYFIIIIRCRSFLDACVCESEKDYFMKILSKYEIKKEKNLLND